MTPKSTNFLWGIVAVFASTIWLGADITVNEPLVQRINEIFGNSMQKYKTIIIKIIWLIYKRLFSRCTNDEANSMKKNGYGDNNTEFSFNYKYPFYCC